MTDAGTTQNNFILPALPVGGLPISQDWLDKMKIVRDCTIPIILPDGNNLLVNMVLKINIGYTNLDTRQIQRRLGSRVCLFIAPNACMAGYSTKMSLLAKFKKTRFGITIPIKVCSSIIYCKAWKHESECKK